MAAVKLAATENVVQLPVSTFDAAWSSMPDRMRKRSQSRDKLRPLWNEHAKRAGGHDRLLAALRAYAADEDTKRTGGQALDRWLRAGRYEHFMPAVMPTNRPVVRFPDEDIRHAVSQALGEPWAISYLDRCGLDGKTLIVASPTAAQRIREKARDLKECGLSGMRIKAD